MATKLRRKTFHHGNLKAAALRAAYDLLAKSGHASLSLRQVAKAVGVAHRSLYNHFEDRDALLDAIAAEAFARLVAILKMSRNSEEYTEAYVRFALENLSTYELMMSRPRGTAKYNPPLQSAVHEVIGEAMRIFCRADQTPTERRRTVMRV